MLSLSFGQSFVTGNFSDSEKGTEQFRIFGFRGFYCPAVAFVSENKMAEGSGARFNESESTQIRNSRRFHHSGLKDLSRINRAINNMEEDEVKRCLEERGLDSR